MPFVISYLIKGARFPFSRQKKKNTLNVCLTEYFKHFVIGHVKMSFPREERISLGFRVIISWVIVSFTETN